MKMVWINRTGSLKLQIVLIQCNSYGTGVSTLLVLGKQLLPG